MGVFVRSSFKFLFLDSFLLLLMALLIRLIARKLVFTIFENGPVFAIIKSTAGSVDLLSPPNLLNTIPAYGLYSPSYVIPSPSSLLTYSTAAFTIEVERLPRFLPKAKVTTAPNTFLVTSVSSISSSSSSIPSAVNNKPKVESMISLYIAIRATVDVKSITA